MRKILISILGVACIFITGCCSIPRVKTYKELHSFTKEEIKTKVKFGKKNKFVSLRDFRENEISGQEITTLKEKVESFISNRIDLNESTKSNLRELKVTQGASKEEVKLLLGQPDKVVKTDKKDIASEIWIYQTSKRSDFTIIFIPVLFGHEKYYLYFKDDILTLIERHYLEQTFYSSDSGMGPPGHK